MSSKTKRPAAATGEAASHSKDKLHRPITAPANSSNIGTSTSSPTTNYARPAAMQQRNSVPAHSNRPVTAPVTESIAEDSAAELVASLQRSTQMLASIDGNPTTEST